GPQPQDSPRYGYDAAQADAPLPARALAEVERLGEPARDSRSDNGRDHSAGVAAGIADAGGGAAITASQFDSGGPDRRLGSADRRQRQGEPGHDPRDVFGDDAEKKQDAAGAHARHGHDGPTAVIAIAAAQTVRDPAARDHAGCHRQKQDRRIAAAFFRSEVQDLLEVVVHPEKEEVLDIT